MGIIFPNKPWKYKEIKMFFRNRLKIILRYPLFILDTHIFKKYNTDVFLMTS